MPAFLALLGLPTLALLFVALSAPDTRAEPPRDRIHRALPPALRPFATPLPPLGPPADKSARLAFLAAIAHRANATHHFSDTPAWRRIGRWPATPTLAFTTKYTSPERSPALFPVPDARHDPAIDFAASVAAANLDPIDFTCNFPRRARFLARRALMPTPLATDTGRCRAIRRWVDPTRVIAIDAIYASPSWNDPSASLGHILFRVRLDHSTPSASTHPEPVFAWVASEGPGDVDNYVWRGLTGGLTASIDISSMDSVIRNYVRDEGRDLHIFELQLSREELRDLIHVVSAQQSLGMEQDYAFFTDNCASLAWDTLASVLTDLPDITRTLAHPHGVVSRLITHARARPLGIIRSGRTAAKVAEDTRDRLAAKLASPSAFPDAEAPDADTTPIAARRAFTHLHATRHAHETARQDAARAFAYALTPLPPLPVATREALAHYVDAVLAIESQLAAMGTDAGIAPGPPASATHTSIIGDLRAARAQLPPTPVPPLPSLATAPITPSGSHLTSISLGAGPDTRTTLTLAFGLVDEQLGEVRQVSLRRGGRSVLLRNAVTFATRPGDPPSLAAWHFTIADILAPGDGFWTGPAATSGSLGFQVAAAFASRPEIGLDLGFSARGGPTWTAFTRNHFADHLIIGLDAEIAARGFDTGFQTALAAGISAEAAIQDKTGGTTLRARIRLAPELTLPLGFGATLDAVVQADLVLDGTRGILLRPTLMWRTDLTRTGSIWDLMLTLVF